MTSIPFNINHKVRFKLTDRGRKVLKYELGMNLPQEDADGWSEWPLSTLMLLLGRFCNVGSEPPFEVEIQLLPLPRSSSN